MVNFVSLYVDNNISNSNKKLEFMIYNLQRNPQQAFDCNLQGANTMAYTQIM